MALKAGIARACITPPLDIPNGMWMAQKHIRAEGLDMDLQGTVIVFADGELRIALIDLDLTFLQDDQAVAIRQSVCDATGIPHANVLPFCTHNHAGPITQSSYRGEGEERVRHYIQSLPHLIGGAAYRAMRSLRPVRVAVGLGHSEIAVNRDLRLPDGSFVVGCNPEGFFDPEVGILRIDTLQGEPYGCIVNYGCHPTVLGPGNKLISPDYPGSTRQTVEKITGATCFFLQGAAGNVGPCETFVSDASIARRLGTQLGLEAARVYLETRTRPVEKRLKGIIRSGAALAEYEEIALFSPEPRLAIVSDLVRLPTRSPLGDVYEQAPTQLEEWKQRLSKLQGNGGAVEDVAQAVQQIARLNLRCDRMQRYKGSSDLPVEAHAIRVGEAAIVAIAGEPYSEIGVEIKARSPFERRTLFAGYLGGDMMYIPTAESYQYQPAPMEVDNSPYSAEAAQIAIDHLLCLLSTVDGVNRS